MYTLRHFSMLLSWWSQKPSPLQVNSKDNLGPIIEQIKSSTNFAEVTIERLLNLQSALLYFGAKQQRPEAGRKHITK